MLRTGRIQPLMPVQAYRTFSIAAPPATHFEPATCEQVDCTRWRLGWRTTVDESTGLGAQQAAYIRGDKSRTWTERRTPDGLTEFTFQPGQRCFGSDRHRRKLDRPDLFFVRDGDWRGNPFGTRPRQHTRAEFWVEEMAENLGRIADEIKKG